MIKDPVLVCWVEHEFVINWVFLVLKGALGEVLLEVLVGIYKGFVVICLKDGDRWMVEGYLWTVFNF